MFNDFHTERFREEIEGGDFEVPDATETVRSKEEKFERQRSKEKHTEEEKEE